MTLHEATPPPLTRSDVAGTIWERLASLRGEGEQTHPFALDSPSREENPQLVVGEVRRIMYRGEGRILFYNPDLPAGVTADVLLDGVSKIFSHGNEQGARRWDLPTSPLRFTNSLEIVITNATAAAQNYRFHISGA